MEVHSEERGKKKNFYRSFSLCNFDSYQPSLCCREVEDGNYHQHRKFGLT